MKHVAETVFEIISGPGSGIFQQGIGG